jgi:2-polyprenyl-6-methoxyphenol hydroxylase-like FAD-dependent oxidoreductase
MVGTEVLIIGAGPVGLTLAVDLGLRGVRCTLVEQDAEMVARFAKTIAMPLPFEMINCSVWRQNLVIADRYGSGSRVFLAGDAVHLVIPTGGLGMNTGCGDAIDLSWKLTATIADWGGPNLLKSYEIERRQVGERNVAAARFAATGRRKWRSMWRPNIRDATPEGAETRANLARVADVEQRKCNEMVRARLSLCRGAPDWDGAGRRTEAQFHRLRAEHLSRRAPAPCLA